MNKELKKYIAECLVFAELTLLNGCSKNVECDVNGPHAHTYVNEEGFAKKICSEKEKINGYYRDNEYVRLDEEEEKYINFVNKNGLLRISDNYDTIKDFESNQKDYFEYEYSYLYNAPMIGTRYNGENFETYTYYAPMIGYDWTKDNNHNNLTGKERIIHPMYKGYKIEINDKGKYILVASNLVNSIEELPIGFFYIKEDFCIYVIENDVNIELNYKVLEK